MVEGEMIGRNAGLERSEYENLAVAGDLEDGPAAVAHIEVLSAVEGDAGGDTHALGIRGHGAVGSNTVYGAIMPRRDVHLAGTVKGDTGGVHHLAEEGPHGVAGIDLEDRDGDFLSAASREGSKDIAFMIESGIGDGMQVFRHRGGNAKFVGIAAGAVGDDHHVS